MRSRRFDELAARALERSWPEAPANSWSSELDRTLAIRAMRDAMGRRARRRALGWGAVAAASIAAGISLFTFVNGHGSAPPAPQVRRAAATPSLRGSLRHPNGAVLAPGEVVAARGEEQVLLSSDSGTRLWMGDEGELAVVEAGPAQRLRLARGRVYVEVAPLRAGERFVIQTGDAEVEVRGTAFDVRVVAGDPRCRGGSETRVAVTHGVVSVRSGGRAEQVRAGQQWPPECAPTEAAAAVTSEHATVAHPGVRRTRGVTRRAETVKHDATPAAPRRSPLAEQNDLLAAALAKKAAGRPEQALADLGELIERWPDSPLAESAMAQRMRLLMTVGRLQAARRAAEDYLRRFPAGFAHEEAQAIAGGGSPE